MKRRDLIAIVAGAAVARPTAVRAQKAMALIGFLGATSPGPVAPYLTAFRQGLSESGYVEGQNVAIEFRWAEGGYDRLPVLAADVVSRKVDEITTIGLDLASTYFRSTASTRAG